MMKHMVKGLMVVLALSSASAQADWHMGKPTSLKIGYDGRSVMFNLSGLSRTNCTCYAAWNSDLCLNPIRESYKTEIAMLMSARARGTDVYVNIDEVTCFVTAMYEAG